MFTQHTNKPLAQVVKTYLRLKDKKSFPVMFKLPIILADLKDVVIKKTKIPEDDLIVMLQGKQIDFKNQLDPIELKDKSILHIINKKYLRNDILDLLVRLVLRNEEKSCLGETKLVARADQPIQEFIEKQILPVIQQRTCQKLTSNCVNLVSNGNVLKKDLKFHNYLIENGAEIICMINFIEELQRSVKNLSTHKLIASHRQVKLYQSLKVPTSKEKQITTTEDKKTFQAKQPEKQIEQKQHQASQNQEQNTKMKLERKQNISPKYFESDVIEKLSPTLYPQFADLLNKDISDGWQGVPESPVSVQYPKAQKKSQTNVQWYDQKAPQKTQLPSQDFKLQTPEKPVMSEQENLQKQQKIEPRNEESKVKLGDFLMISSTKNPSEKKSRSQFLEEMSEKVDSFLGKKYEQSEFSQIAIEYPQLQKKISVKPGDLIICGDMFMNSSKLISQNLLQKFNELIQQKNKKMEEDYELEQRLNKGGTSQEAKKTPQIS